MTRQSLDLLSPDPALEASLAAGLAQVEQELRESVRSSSPFISEAAGYLVEAGGKRFRPLLHGGDTVRLEHPGEALLLHGVYATDRSEALLCVVQMDTSVAMPGTPIRLPGLPAQGRYRISVVPITGSDAVVGPAVSQPGWITDGITLSGAQLASHGLQPPILHPEQALLVHLVGGTA